MVPGNTLNLVWADVKFWGHLVRTDSPAELSMAPVLQEEESVSQEENCNAQN